MHSLSELYRLNVWNSGVLGKTKCMTRFWTSKTHKRHIISQYCDLLHCVCTASLLRWSYLALVEMWMAV